MTTAGGAAGALLALAVRVDSHPPGVRVLANTEPGVEQLTMKTTKKRPPGIKAQLWNAFRRGYRRGLSDAQQIVAEVLCGKKPEQADKPAASD